MLKSVSSIANAIGAINYKGTWNASTNVPNLGALTTALKGDYYVVSTAGSTNLGGITTWYVGDWAVYNGSAWQRVEGGADDPAPSIRSNSTTGLLEITGPAAGQTRVMTTPDANFTAARTDASNSFTGDQTLATGNLVIGTAGKGIDFSASPSAPGMTSELLDDYEEGTWTPTFVPNTGTFASITYTANQYGLYTKIGNIVYFTFTIETNSLDITGAGPFVNVSGFPFAAADTAAGNVSSVSAWAGDFPLSLELNGGAASARLLYRTAVNGASIRIAPADMGLGASSNFTRVSGVYITNV